MLSQTDTNRSLETLPDEIFSLCNSIIRGSSEIEAILEGVVTAVGSTAKDSSENKRTIAFSAALQKLAELEESGEALIVAEEIQNGSLFETAVAKLSFECRVVYVLHDTFDFAVSELADLLKISELEVKAYLHRARLEMVRSMRSSH